MNLLKKRRGATVLTMAITAAAVSGIVALGVSRIVSVQFSSVASTSDKMKAQHDALNRAEIIRASAYDSIASSSSALTDGLFEDVVVTEGVENNVAVKTARINIYKDQAHTELVSSVVVKRTNPTIALTHDYKAEGGADIVYSVSAVNDNFAHIASGNVGSKYKPVYLENGQVTETDLSGVEKSNSAKLAVINDDGTFGYISKSDLLAGEYISTITIGEQSSDGGVFTRTGGAPISSEPRTGQILIVTNDRSSGSKWVGRYTAHSTFELALKDSVTEEVGSYHRTVFALGFNKYYNRNQFPAPDCYGVYYSPFVLMYDGSSWVVIGASEAASATGGNNAFYSNGS